MKGRGRSLSNDLDVLHILELLLDSAAVTTRVRITPGDHGSIVQHSSKCMTSCLTGPTYASRCGLDSAATSHQVTVSKCEKAVFW